MYVFHDSQLAELPSIMAPVFIEVIQAGLPVGVELSVHEHNPEETQVSLRDIARPRLAH